MLTRNKKLCNVLIIGIWFKYTKRHLFVPSSEFVLWWLLNDALFYPTSFCSNPVLSPSMLLIQTFVFSVFHWTLLWFSCFSLVSQPIYSFCLHFESSSIYELISVEATISNPKTSCFPKFWVPPHYRSDVITASAIWWRMLGPLSYPEELAKTKYHFTRLSLQVEVRD